MSNDIQKLDLEYSAAGATCKSYLALPADTTAPVPGIIVLHEWWGCDDYVRGRADQLAGLGYAALAADMYGEGQQADDPEAAGALMTGLMGDPAQLSARFEAARSALASRAEVDGSRIAAAGYCMGGGIALEMARAGAELAAVASFHGALETQTPATEGAIQAKLLVCTGAADPFVPTEHVDSLRSELAAAGASCEIVAYPDVIHAFTNPGATARGERFVLPLRYDEGADQDSWTRMAALLKDVF